MKQNNQAVLTALIGKTFQIAAYSKINLRLKVLGREANGMHKLSMLNSTLDLADQVRLSFLQPTTGTEPQVLGCSVHNLETGALIPEIPQGGQNIAAKAAENFLRTFDIPLSCSIELKKAIPVGAGLAGGSSDAAAVLKILSTALRDYLDPSQAEDFEKQLLKLSLALGADLPFCYRANFARVTGLGEHVDSYAGSLIQGMPVLLIVPEIQILTAKVYQNLREAKPELPTERDYIGERFADVLRINTPGTEYEPWPSRTIKATIWRDVRKMIDNDLLPYALLEYPKLGDILQELKTLEGAIAGLSGSGASLFLLPQNIDGFPDNELRARALEIANKYSARVIEARLAPENPVPEVI